MTTFDRVRQWLEQDKDSVFENLDADGYGQFSRDGGCDVYLFADPDPSGEKDVLLYARLANLDGLSGDAQLAFLWAMAEENIVGAQPTGYRFFADAEDLSIYLGCQFDPKGMDHIAFSSLVDAFIRYTEVQLDRMADLLEGMEAEDEGDGLPTEAAGVPAAPQEGMAARNSALDMKDPRLLFNPGVIRG